MHCRTAGAWIVGLVDDEELTGKVTITYRIDATGDGRVVPTRRRA